MTGSELLYAHRRQAALPGNRLDVKIARIWTAVALGAIVRFRGPDGGFPWWNHWRNSSTEVVLAEDWTIIPRADHSNMKVGVRLEITLHPTSPKGGVQLACALGGSFSSEPLDDLFSSSLAHRRSHTRIPD